MHATLVIQNDVPVNNQFIVSVHFATLLSSVAYPAGPFGLTRSAGTAIKIHYTTIWASFLRIDQTDTSDGDVHNH